LRSTLDKLVCELFRTPGGYSKDANAFLRHAARAHRALLARAAREGGHRKVSGSLLPRLHALVERIPCQELRNRFLVDPTFIEGLHAAAGDSEVLGRWHRQIADPSVARIWPAALHGHSQLGNSLLALVLRGDPEWQGEVPLQSDLFGRLRFPLCHWSLALSSNAPGGVVSSEELTGSFSRHEVRLSPRGRRHDELLVMPRREWLRMLIDDDERLDCRRIRWPRGERSLRFQRAAAFPGWCVRYDPVFAPGADRHAEMTGGLVTAALNAMAHHSPNLAAEFDAIESSVRGWELAPGADGTLQSFSDPTLPRVMGINVPYTADDQPQISPFFFTWFGHELGHTLSYLIETILFVQGQSLTSRRCEFTETIARYGRAVPVRTLLQIPYTHLYEWVLMIEFLEGGFSALPWTICEDPVEHVEEIRAEIQETFDRIARSVPLSDAGRSVIARLRRLYSDVLARSKQVV